MTKCPKCGGEHLAPIHYGYPAFNEETKRRVEQKELFLGGCRITGCDPQFHCFDCGKNVGKPPVLLTNKYGEEDYRDIVTSVLSGTRLLNRSRLPRSQMRSHPYSQSTTP